MDGLIVKRANNIYHNLYNITNIINTYKIVKKNTKNKHKLELFDDYYTINIYRIYNTLKNHSYVVGNYNKFTIYEPKQRLILSQNIYDKVINHLVAHELSNILDISLIDTNVATRTCKGTSYGIKVLRNYLNTLKNTNYYVLKIDITKYFYNIDHIILKNLLKTKIKYKYFLSIVFNIIDSTSSVPEYKYGKGLPIGNMTSQILGIYYLNNIDHYIKEKLHIKYYIRYMDDFLIIDNNKEYLKYILTKITELLTDYQLQTNNKTVITPKKQGINFLGYHFINNKIYILSKNKHKITKKLKLLSIYNPHKYKLVLASYKGYIVLNYN